MKIAVTYDQGMVFQHFGHTEEFKIYTVENNEIVKSEVIQTNGVGHCALGNFLATLEVEVLICGGIGMGAINNLNRAGIAIYPGVMGEADMMVEDFISGNLEYDPETRCNHHHDHDHNCGEHHHHDSCKCHD